MYYSSPVIITAPIGNNIFSYAERIDDIGTAEIVIPRLIDGTVDDIKLGDAIVFAEMDEEDIRLCTGLQSIVCLSQFHCPIYVMDNHNHALYCWYKECLAGTIQKGLPCLHIDQHSDMKDPMGWIDVKKEKDLPYIAAYVNEVSTIADFIQPALRSGLLGECIQLRTEYGLLHYDISKSLRPGGDVDILSDTSLSQGREKEYVLDIDIDFWAPEMGIGDFDRTIKKTRQLIAGASMVTIATSPYFIDQKRAVDIVKLLL